MKIAQFSDASGNPVGIPVKKITGFCKVEAGKYKTFIATGPEGADGGGNGWCVVEGFETVKAILENS